MGFALAGEVHARVADSHAVTWVGLDYTLTRMYVPEPLGTPGEKVFWGPGGGLRDFVGTFDSPQDAWLRLCSDWNTMFVNERVQSLRDDLEAKVEVALPGACGPTRTRSDHWFDSEFERAGPMLTEADIAERVRQYPGGTGVGYAVVVERISKPDKAACGWPVFYDRATSAVLRTERMCVKPSGMEFRNYWFNAVAELAERGGELVRRRDW